MASGADDSKAIDLKVYDIIVASDIINDAMHLEIYDKRRDLVLLVTRWDVDGRMTLTAGRDDVPLELVEWAIETAKRRLT